jgi:methylmalonyl-CoA/ethylmalonyl-CoA epimerase
MKGGGSLLERVHHIDFVVRDLTEATARFARVFGREPGPRERLESRGIELVRFRIGEVWLILVQPVQQDSPVMKFLEKHGEGFFHIAFKVDDVEAETRRLKELEVQLQNDEPRRGVEGWKLIDIALEETCGVMIQLAEED